VSGYDVPFGLTKPDSFVLHLNGKEVPITGLPAQPVFDDTRQYWYPEAPGTGVKLRAVGVGLQVLSQNGTSMRVKLFPTR
jgi:immune inhibitor A